MSSFGWGQRACLGQTLTQDEMLMACGTVCWGFNMGLKTDPATGKKIEIDIAKSNSLLIIKPDPFQMAFEPRSEERRLEMIENWKASEAQDIADRQAFEAAGAAAAASMKAKELN